jgi:hypothetical protein
MPVNGFGYSLERYRPDELPMVIKDNFAIYAVDEKTERTLVNSQFLAMGKLRGSMSILQSEAKVYAKQ